MTIVQIRRDKLHRASFWDQAFRVFFLSAALFSILSIIAWMFLYCFYAEISTAPLTNYLWHAHEMIYGFTIAVISGFLLTAVPYWTGHTPIRKFLLFLLYLLWCLARLCFFMSYDEYVWAGLFDILFNLILFYGISSPILISRSWQYVGVVCNVLLLCVLHVVFYYGIFFKNIYLSQMSLYVTIYVIISLIMTISNRVLPGYVANTLKLNSTPPPLFATSLLIIFLFLVFVFNQIFFKTQILLQAVSPLLSFLILYRLSVWYDVRIWRHSLLWGVFVANFFIAVGFLFYFLTTFGIVSEYLALHAFAYGGIGFSTLSMMSRVILGHSGGDVFTPPRSMRYVLLILCVGIFFRLCVPLIEPRGYVAWIFLSQIAWCLSFVFFILGHRRYLISKGS